MKFSFYADKERNEVIVYAPEKTELITEIEHLARKNSSELIGYKNKEAIKLSPDEILCFISENNRVFAVTEKEKLLLRLRLYQLEESLSSSFVKINQSCIANIRQIKKFNASFSGTLQVTFKNGYTDYVARRRLKEVKERLGVKL